MTETPELRGYHAHVYYDAASRPEAERLRDRIAGQFPVELGRFSDEPIGPHPISQFAVILRTEQFQEVVPWLMFNRGGLDVLIHPLTDDSVDDHRIYAVWLGKPAPMKLNGLRRTYRSELLPTA
jgi:aromatic ring-cleaving dioxygenase